MQRPFFASGPRLAVLAASALAAACSSSDDDEASEAPFTLRNTVHSVAASTPLAGQGDWLAYLADEASQGPGTDLNGDGDLVDSVAVRVDTRTGDVLVLGVDAETLAWANGTLFLEVNEATDGEDWNGDLDEVDTVLLYHITGAAQPTFFAELRSGVTPAFIVAGSTVVFATATAPTVEFETNLAFSRVAAPAAVPSAPMPIVSTIDDPQDNGLTVRFAGRSGDVVFCTLDENIDGNLNGDLDTTDATVLAVLDAAEAAPTLLGTGLALSSNTAIAAAAIGTDWLAAFLVSEAAQSQNLNDPALFVPTWQPPNCSGRNDVDQLDHVLHWFLMSDLVANANVVNTGLVGTDTGPVLAHPDSYVAVVSLEQQEGNNGCDLNGDADFVDPIFRWVDASDPTANVLPVTDPARLLAVARTLAGGSGGMVTVGSLFAIAVDEEADGRDHDGMPLIDRTLVAAHAPASAGQAWNFLHGGNTPIPVAVSWMADDSRSSGRFLAAITEAGRGADINGDMDLLDSVPTFPNVVTANRLGFPGVGVAVVPSNAGISTAGGYAFYRVSEAADGNRDRNGDGDMNDEVLQRVALTGSAPTFMGSLNNVSTPALGVALDGVEFGAYIYQESMFGATGNDLNGDGNATDFVVRFFRLP
jgi:hypothetical protein